MTGTMTERMGMMPGMGMPSPTGMMGTAGAMAPA